MAVEVVSLAFPVLVAALWGCARRFPGGRALLLALFAALVMAGIPMPRVPIRLRGGGMPQPDSWESFEEMFWAHVRAQRVSEGAASRGGK